MANSKAALWTHYVSILLAVLTYSSMAVAEKSPDDRFCNEITTAVIYTKCRACLLNRFIICPLGSVKLTTMHGKADCSYLFMSKLHLLRLPGCRHMCKRTLIVTQCCPGNWGSNCEDCPGGSDNPCYGHGSCNNGTHGNGTCLCQENFGGFGCKDCANNTMYGKNCSEECLCENGDCNSGIAGNGSCTCWSGFKGEFCEEEIAGCVNVTCVNGSQCGEVDGKPVCICSKGYWKNLLGECRVKNRCFTSPCHRNANCQSTGPALYKCACKDGYQGDGIVCEPIDNCQKNYGDCVSTSSSCVYTGPGMHRCDCLAGHENYIAGVGCTLIDLCIRNKSLCHEHAACQTTGPEQVECVCYDGFTGDGKLCYGNIIQRLKLLNETDDQYAGSLGFAIRVFEQHYGTALSQGGPFTLFVPVDGAFRQANRAGQVGYGRDLLSGTERGRQVLRQHIIAKALTQDQLYNMSVFYTLQGSLAQLQFRRGVFRFKIHGARDKGKIVRGDVVAFNGIIHIINSLMTFLPEYLGDETETVLNVIKGQPRYTKFANLIRLVGSESHFQRENITVFCPSEEALTTAYSVIAKYIRSEEEIRDKVKGKVIRILQNHIFLGWISAADLIQQSRIVSTGNTAVSVEVTPTGMIVLNGNVSIRQTDMSASNGLLHHIEGVLQNAVFDDLLPRKCDHIYSRIVNGSCGPCHGVLRCMGTTDQALDVLASGCTYWVKTMNRYVPYTGCARACNRTYVSRRCCSGFFGSECQMCPGGYKNPCSGHGQCLDGRHRNGTCICERNFTGTICERCSEANMFGPNCSTPCTCLSGRCDSGPSGSGRCHPNTCLVGYTGENCDRQVSLCRQSGYRLSCHAHAVCVENEREPNCVCSPGYEGDGLLCQQIDPCRKADRGGCHKQATCIKAGPGMNQCECGRGWMGDGKYCVPVTPCVLHTDCHANATCSRSSPGQFVCLCNDGYHGNGTMCAPTNSCLTDNGGCNHQAMCVSIGAGKRNCTCPDGWGGDGVTCYGSIATEVNSHTNLKESAYLLNSLPANQDILTDLNSTYTLFAPSDYAIRNFSTLAASRYWEKSENIINLISYHTLDGQYSISTLLKYTALVDRVETLATGFFVNVTAKDQVLYVNDAKVIIKDIPALNGYIHIIDKISKLEPVQAGSISYASVLAGVQAFTTSAKVLEPYPVTGFSSRPSLTDFFKKNGKFSRFLQYLNNTGLLADIERLNDYTVFAPTNAALKNYNVTLTKRILSFYVVAKALLSYSLIDGQTEDTVLGANHKLIFAVHDKKVWVNEVKIMSPDILTEGGVVHEISDILKITMNRCDATIKKTDYGSCVACTGGRSICPHGFQRLEEASLMPTECTYRANQDDGYTYNFIGCQALCQKIETVLGCCSGFYGQECFECPGGPDVPCSDHGICNDGLYGTGSCGCRGNFGGRICQRCQPGWVGPYCNSSSSPCSINNGGCSANAVCQIASGQVTCVCRLGFIGDGQTCRKLCDIHNGGCHEQAICSQKSFGVVCQCKNGYHGNGMKNCAKIDNLCESNNGGCASVADCQFVPPAVTDVAGGQVTCLCPTGYAGNGSICNTDLYSTIRAMDSTQQFYQLLTSGLSSMKELPELVDQLKDYDKNFTMFIPVNEGMSKLNSQNLNLLDIKTHLLNYTVMISHDLLMDGTVSRESLSGRSLIFSKELNEYFVNDVAILARNIPTMNGFMNLIASPLQYEVIPLRVAVQSKISLIGPIIGGVIVILVITAVLIGVVWYIKARRTGFLDLRKKMAKGCDKTLLEKLDEDFADDEEEPDLNIEFDISPSDSSVKFNNPLYHGQK